MVVLFRISPAMTILAFSFPLCFAIALNKAFDDSADFPAARKNQR
jgi:hypothetical protein